MSDELENPTETATGVRRSLGITPTEEFGSVAQFVRLAVPVDQAPHESHRDQGFVRKRRERVSKRRGAGVVGHA